MFFLWVTIMAAATKTENILKIVDGVSKNRKRNTGKAMPVVIEEMETIPVISSTARKTPRQHRVRRGCIASSVPKTVDTPLPPLKPAKTGNICPMMATKPVKI